MNKTEEVGNANYFQKKGKIYMHNAITQNEHIM